VQGLVSVVTKLALVNDVSSTELLTPASMARGRNVRRVSNVARTSERISLKTVTLVRHHHVFSETNTNTPIAYTGEAGEGEWNHANPATSAATTSAAIQAVAQFAPPPEGYYPYFYPPPGFIPPGHEGQPGPEGGPSNATGQPQPVLQYYVHPGGYPPYSHYPHPGAPYAQHAQPPQTLNPSEATKKPDEPKAAEQSESAPATKKKSRATKNGESKAKKSKVANAKGKKVNGVAEPPVASAPVEGHEADGPA
jgi:hypothetical protein